MHEHRSLLASVVAMITAVTTNAIIVVFVLSRGQIFVSPNLAFKLFSILSSFEMSKPEVNFYFSGRTVLIKSTIWHCVKWCLRFGLILQSRVQ